MTSEKVDQLDPPSEVFYRRLLSKVDDHGLYDARPSILRATLFPLRIDKVREADCSRWMAACQKAGLIVLYEADSKPYLKALNTQWDARSKPKYPLPSGVIENSCKQPETPESNRTVVVDVVVSEDVGVGSAELSPAAAASPSNGKGMAYIPLNDNSEFPITDGMVKEFESLYPAVDVLQTLREIRGWNLANPTKRKTKTGVLRHVNSWLAKEQNKGA